MQETLKVLGQIQKIDLEIKAVEEEQKEYLATVDALGAELKASGDAIAALEEEVAGLKAQAGELDERIRESVEKAAKDEKKISAVKNDRELSALTKEINNANKAKRQAEQDKAALDVRIAEKDAALADRKEAMRSRQDEFDRLSGELDGKSSNWNEAIEERLDTRKATGAGLRPDVFRKYEMIRSRRGGLGLVPVRNEICQGCFTHIPPQVYIMLKKGTEELQSCPHCHRLLYAEVPGELEAV